MSITLSAGYTWTDGEVVTATKLNLAAVPTVANNQSYLFSDGTAALPSISFSTDTNTGLYHYAADTIGWSANGLVYGTLGAGISTLNGDNTTGSGAIAQLAFGFGGAFSYQHFLQTRHNSAVGGTGNAAVLWLNTSATAGASSAPGTNNAKAFDFSADNLKFYSNNGTLGLTLDNTSRLTTAGPLTVTGSATLNVGATGSLTVSGSASCSITLTDSSVANASWLFLAQTGNATKLFRLADATNGDRLLIDASGNLALGASISAGSGAGVFFIANGTAPSGSPTGGGIVYVESGALKYKGSSGTVTVLGVA